MIKRGQITMFIIIAIIIIGIFLTFFFINLKQKQKLELSIEPYVENCIEKTFIEAIKYTSLQGGYYEAPTNSINYLFFNIPYIENHPSKIKIESEVSNYIKSELFNCLDFSLFEEQGYEFTYGEIDIKTTLDKEAIVKLKYPITIKKEGNTKTIKEFNYYNKFDYNKIYKLITEFITEHNKNPDYIPIGYISLLADKNNINFDIIYTKNDEVVYSFIFSKLFSGNITIIYNIAGKYDWKELDIKTNPVEIDPIPFFKIYAGNLFNYQVKAKGNNIRFDDYTELFDIEKTTGNIRFTPNNEQSGDYEILIKAKDNKGNEDSLILRLSIEKVFENLNLNL